MASSGLNKETYCGLDFEEELSLYLLTRLATPPISVKPICAPRMKGEGGIRRIGLVSRNLLGRDRNNRCERIFGIGVLMG